MDNGKGLPACFTTDAAFCPQMSIIYLDNDFLNQQNATYGRGAVAVIVAHEYAHFIQHQLKWDNQPTFLNELQADCFADKWFATTVAHGTFTNDDTLAALGSLLDAGADYASPFTPDAHGDGSQRADAFLAGLNGSDCKYR